MKKRAKNPLATLHPVERAIITRDWRAGVSLARIAAILSDNSDHMVQRAGTVFFVVLGAAVSAGWHEDDWQMRIIRGSVNAVYDQAGVEVITPERRASIGRGLQVAAEMVPTFTHEQLVHSACDLALKLKTGHVHISDFDALTMRIKLVHDVCVVAL